ncbi:MAG: hypothetical protein OXR66_00255 [Candidatus Woesearchaeota archaeon]|nr:hypothetical protein [Candidatus Woesearchaeota archaeon]
MQTFTAQPKKWGHSVAITIPSNIVRDEGITTKKKITVMVRTEKKPTMKDLFGTLKMKKPVDQLMREIDEGWN